jgi:hypothetical protein
MPNGVALPKKGAENAGRWPMGSKAIFAGDGRIDGAIIRRWAWWPSFAIPVEPDLLKILLEVFDETQQGRNRRRLLQ